MNQGRGVSGGIMSPADQGGGYLMLSLKSDGKEVGRTVHSLVMEVHGVGREQTFDQVQEWIAAHGKP